ncbi:MAG: hypothetical protein IKU01_07470 [Bacteroidales bacterium]|nr:hypothetical protein [Bacteroidales bacterium]
MDNSTIEQLGINAVTTYLCTCGYISPQIDKNDKTPMWDGFLYVYNNPNKFCNESFHYRIPVQVKASECGEISFPSETSYSIPVVNLKNYLKEGGAVFFKVLVKKLNSEIYVSFLTKERIEKLLSGIKTQKQKTIALKLEKKPETVDVLLSNLRRIFLQKSRPLIDLSAIQGKKNVTFKFSVKKPTKDVDPLAYLASQPVDIMLSIGDLPCEFFVKDGPSRLKFVAVSHSKISIEGKTYYTEFKKEYDEKELRILVGRSCVISIEEQEENFSVRFSFTFKPSTIDENISELEFLLAVKKYEYICFDSFKINLDEFEKSNDISDHWRTTLKFWQDVKNLFLNLQLPLDLDFKDLTEREESDLNILINALLYNQKINANVDGNRFYDFKIRELIIRVASLKYNDNTIRLFDINDLESVYVDSNNKPRMLPASSSIFEMKELPDNIRFSNLVETYKQFEKKNDEVVLRANLDLLNMLNHYDKKPDEKLLNAAYELSKWLKNKRTNKLPNATAAILNYLQTIKRMNTGFSKYEKRLLNGIVPKDDSERFACCLLNDDIKGATKYFRQLPKKVQDEFKQMPIYHFMNS